MIIVPEACTISPPGTVVRAMPSWEVSAPSPRCDGTHMHDWKMQTGFGCLLVCRHCKSAGWLWPLVAGHA